MYYYITAVTHDRVPVFRSKTACEIFISQLKEVKEKFPFKLIGYVLMPDHFHILVKLEDNDPEKFMLRLRGLSARKIIDWLKEKEFWDSLLRLKLKVPQKRRYRYAVWQKNPTIIEIWSPKFLRQKLDYIHMNPVRAGLCEHPRDWKWSSYNAYQPHEPGTVPIEIDAVGQ
ncbi:MAG: transposase [Acidobacteria bacterium]|nr:transposase [Acidobacteriota bacterium]